MATAALQILLVDDSAEIRQVWRRILTSRGYKVLEAADGAEGVREARRSGADLIVMDLTMPVLDGIEAIKELKADPLTSNVPVLVVSGDAYAAGRVRAVGGEGFLAKPVRAADLLRAVAQTIERSRQTQFR